MGVERISRYPRYHNQTSRTSPPGLFLRSGNTTKCPVWTSYCLFIEVLIWLHCIYLIVFRRKSEKGRSFKSNIIQTELFFRDSLSYTAPSLVSVRPCVGFGFVNSFSHKLGSAKIGSFSNQPFKYEVSAASIGIACLLIDIDVKTNLSKTVVVSVDLMIVT